MKENNTDIIYLDFNKAFDTVSHCHLQLKIENLGISNKIVNIIQCFLTGRTMKVKIGNNYSKTQNISSSVP